MALAQRTGWLCGFQDETWWSRFAHPALSSWSAQQQPLRLVEQVPLPTDPDPKALACYGLLLRWWPGEQCVNEKMLLGFVDGRPVSELTIQFLTWACQQVAELGHAVLVLIWDNARWHTSAAVRTWLRQHNRAVKRTGQGVRLLSCFLPIKSPWLNNIEPKWAYGKRHVVEPDRVLSKQELADRICQTFDCQHFTHLLIPEHLL
jgi:transposase